MRLSLLKSALGHDFQEDGNVKILIELEPGQTPCFSHMAEWEMDLTEKLGRQVDLCVPKEISQPFRHRHL